MTRKDYELIASAILRTRFIMESVHCDLSKAKIAYHALDQLEQVLSEELLADNPRFTPNRFHQACNA